MDNQKINDLIFKELIKRGYAKKDEKRIWNIGDSKLWYLKPEQAQAYLDFEHSEPYKSNVVQKELGLIHEEMKTIIDKMKDKKINIIDLGSGDGKKAVEIIKELKDKAQLRYCPIDISSYMVEKALKNVKKVDIEEVVKLQWNISDFENIENVSSVLRFGGYNEHLFLILGNTLGNFEINELLYEIRSAMKEGDHLLIGNGLDNRNPEDILKSYKTEQVDNFLKFIPLQLGLKVEETTFDARFENSRVEIFYTLKENKTIEFQKKKIEFKEGDEIIVGFSYKYNRKDFMTFLKLYFDEVDMITSKDESYTVALCKK